MPSLTLRLPRPLHNRVRVSTASRSSRSRRTSPPSVSGWMSWLASRSRTRVWRRRRSGIWRPTNRHCRASSLFRWVAVCESRPEEGGTEGGIDGRTVSNVVHFGICVLSGKTGFGNRSLFTSFAKSIYRYEVYSHYLYNWLHTNPNLSHIPVSRSLPQVQCNQSTSVTHVNRPVFYPFR